jgi:7-carboxy-7-deazaguanine synthase
MLGKNKIYKSHNNQNFLHIQEIFPTIQGEGLYVGWPAVFVRLGGCNLQCVFCDTEFDSYKAIDIEEILKTIQQFSYNKNQKRTRKLVVITGGEPMLQPIEFLCQKLIENNFLVQIETNGTFYRKLPAEVKIICSPKNNKNNVLAIKPWWQDCISAFKFVVSDSVLGYEKIFFDLNSFNIPVYVQPIDENCQKRNLANLNLALDLCNQYGYILSLQTHKLIGVR